MKIFSPALALLSLLGSGFGVAQQTASPPSGSSSSLVSTRGSAPTATQQTIEALQQQIQAHPEKVQAYNDLAIVFLRRARETANPAYVVDAERAISQGLVLDGKNFPLQKTHIAALLASHRFIDAKEKATELNRHTPDDVALYGYLAEADIALGDYVAAEKSTQWMLNMLPNNVPGLLLGARLRTLFGDAEGALELLDLAYTETSPTEVEELAWIGNQVASVEINLGKSDAAGTMLERSKQIFPRYPYTTENLARVRLSQHHPENAIALFQQATEVDADPGILYELAEAEAVAGHPAAASATYEKFERLASAPGNQMEDAKRDLILYYANDPVRSPFALKLAVTEIATRKDVWTLDAYAWALYANGRFQEADVAIQKALVIGIQSAQIFDHAGHIEQRLHHDADAARYFERSIHADPSSRYAADARSAGGTGANEDSQKLVTVRDVRVSPAAQTVAVIAAPNLVDPNANVPSFSPVAPILLTPRPTDTDRLIRNAQARVARSDKDATGFATLGAAYFQRARETGNVDDYQLAERSLNMSLDLVSADFSADAALGTMAEVCMGEHRFADALIYSQKALALGSGDVSPFAIVGDAYADMGEYEKAKLAYARLTPREMTLSPRAAYARDSRLSYLRFIAGDTLGAIALMKTAVAEGTEAQLPSENLAWLYYELGEFLTQVGDTGSADKVYVAALTIHPGDYRALAGLGKLRANRGSYTEAVELYKRAIAIVPMPLFVAELGDLYATGKNQAQAKQQYQLVEYIGLLGSINQVLHNRDLALFYADHDTKLPEALKLAQKEFEVRHDVYTWDALAWALFKNGKLEEAAKASAKALRFGTRDSLLLFHAGMIADKMGHKDQAQDDLKQALQINPRFHLLYAKVAQQRLASMNVQAALGSGENHHAH